MVEILKVGKLELPVRVSYKVLKRISTLSAEDEGQYDRLERLLFFSLVEGFKAEGEECKYTVESVEDLIDEFPEIIPLFTKIMDEQMGELTVKMSG